MAVLNWRQIYLANPTTTFQGTDILYLARSPYGIGNDFGFLYSSMIPVATKGDLFTFSTINAALPLGSQGTLLTVDTTTATGLKWTTTTFPSTIVQYEVLYASNPNAVSGIGNNLTTTKMYLSQVGTGLAATAPVWAAIAGADVTGSALTAANDTNVTLTLGGSPTNALLNAASVTAGWTGQLSLARGGTNANLTASTGALVYSTASAFALLANTSNINNILMTNVGGGLHWSTSTFPELTASGDLLVGTGLNTWGLLAPTASTILSCSGASAPTWISTVGVANGGTGTSTAFTAGSVVFAGASGVYSQNNGNFFWDNTNNRLGIGTATPGVGLVVIPGATTSFVNYIQGASTTWSGVGGNGFTSIQGSNWIAAGTGFGINSDERIKNILNVSNSSEDLETIKKIPIVDYEYKDKISNGSKPYKKVIAQQIESIYPSAINIGKDAIPDIFKVPEYWIFENKKLRIHLKSHGLKLNEIVRLHLDNTSKNLKIIESEEDYFIVENDSNVEVMFIYGREVDDFRTVDYDALAMLNISATQELCRIIEELRSKIEKLQMNG